MGTNIQVQAPTVDDYWGREGCNKLLVLSKPKIIRNVHAAFFEAGCDVVETNNFGSTRVVQNLVDIILSNNGLKVVNLGIKQPADAIIKAAQEHKADAIGLSGLLVKSTLEMKYVIQDLERLCTRTPVLCGGAALTRKYVEQDPRQRCASAVFYAEDAFAGLHVMSDLTTEDGVRARRMEEGSTVKVYPVAQHIADAPKVEAPMVRSSWVKPVEQTHLKPEQSTNTLVVHHPQAKYFVV